MIFDGIHVLHKGKYFGPPQPGPWSQVVAVVNINPFSLGPLFVGLGLLWLVAGVAIIVGSEWSWTLSLIVAICSLWYMSIGTVLSVVAIAILLLMRFNS